MAKLTDPQQAEEAAQRLLNDRMDYIRRAIWFTLLAIVAIWCRI